MWGLTEEYESWSFGPVEVIKLVQFEAVHPWAMVFDVGGFSPHLLADLAVKVGASYATADSITMSYHSFVVRSSGLTILVDTCWGDRALPFDHGPAADLPTQLEAIGIGVGDVDVVVCTHVHPDHVGWNTVKVDGVWTPTFPNARHLVSGDEYRFLAADAANDPYRLRRVTIEPLVAEGLLDLVPGDHVIDEHVRLIPLPGHTPGHVGVRIDWNDEAVIIAGDVLMSPAQLIDCRLNAVSEHDEVEAVATRRALVERSADQQVTFLGSHFPHPTSGQVRLWPDGSHHWIPDA